MDLLPFFGKKITTDELPPEPKQSKPLTITIGRGAGGYSPQNVGSYGLTPLGRQSVRLLSDNDPNFLVLAAIEESGPLTIGGISEKVNMSTIKVNTLVNGKYGLVAGGKLKKVGVGGE
jgi:hypothetical protein